MSFLVSEVSGLFLGVLLMLLGAAISNAGKSPKRAVKVVKGDGYYD
jgi:hypothetical protein